MVTMPGMAGMFGGMSPGMFGAASQMPPNPYAGMNPYGGSGMAGIGGQGFGQMPPQGMPPPSQMPPWLAAMAQQGQGTPGMTPWGQAGPQTQAAAGQMPQAMPGNWGGILSGLMGRGMPPWAQGQPPRGQPRQMQQSQKPVQPPQARPRRGFTGPAGGTITLSGY